jgi:hypothetical protein
MEPCIAAVHNPTQGRAFSFGDGNRSRESEPNATNRRIAELLGPSQSKDNVRVSARPCHNSSLLTNKFITKVAVNGNLQIKMHGFTSQDLTQR